MHRQRRKLTPWELPRQSHNDRTERNIRRDGSFVNPCPNLSQCIPNIGRADYDNSELHHCKSGAEEYSTSQQATRKLVFCFSKNIFTTSNYRLIAFERAGLFQISIITTGRTDARRGRPVLDTSTNATGFLI
jgi:hypothetical protein